MWVERGLPSYEGAEQEPSNPQSGGGPGQGGRVADAKALRASWVVEGASGGWGRGMAILLEVVARECGGGGCGEKTWAPPALIQARGEISELASWRRGDCSDCDGCAFRPLPCSSEFRAVQSQNWL